MRSNGLANGIGWMIVDGLRPIADRALWGESEPGSLPTRLAKRQRRRMFEQFLKRLSPASEHRILDVGATSDRLHDHSNYLEAWYPHKTRVTAAGMEDASFLEELYPGLRFVQADALALPFADSSYDFVHSSAVIEHVGSHRNQTTFLRELWRVARRGIFVTTPNRWFPIEFHTVLPFIHYLPPGAFRAVLHSLGREFFAQEANLNLMSRSLLADAAQAAGIGDFRIETVSLVGWPSNLMLIARKGI
jgi:hypothetical protein